MIREIGHQIIAIHSILNDRIRRGIRESIHTDFTAGVILATANIGNMVTDRSHHIRRALVVGKGF